MCTRCWDVYQCVRVCVCNISFSLSYTFGPSSYILSVAPSIRSFLRSLSLSCSISLQQPTVCDQYSVIQSYACIAYTPMLLLCNTCFVGITYGVWWMVYGVWRIIWENIHNDVFIWCILVLLCFKLNFAFKLFNIQQRAPCTVHRWNEWICVWKTISANFSSEKEDPKQLCYWWRESKSASSMFWLGKVMCVPILFISFWFLRVHHCWEFHVIFFL